MRDVARLAGVSVATVSRVLSGSSHPVRPETRERVLRVVGDLDFRPNMLARALVTARTGTVGAIVHDISDPYFGEIVRGLEDEAHEHEYQVFACSSDRDPVREVAYVRSLIAQRVEVIVFAGGGIEDRRYQAELRGLLDGFRTDGGTVVLLAPHAYRGPGLIPDNRGGAVAMTRHLLELGHRRIALVAGPDGIRTSRVRLAGHRAALKEAGVDFDPALVANGFFTIDGGAKAISELLERGADLTAVFAANDIMAFGVLDELADRGIPVPEEVSVAGFDDVQMASYVRPPLTTVRIPMYEMGRGGMQMALDLLAGGQPRSRQLATHVVVRESTSPARKRW